jgi:hypothetical protein
MEDVRILNGHLVYFMIIWYVLWPFGIFMIIWYILPVLVRCAKKNLATLVRACHVCAIACHFFNCCHRRRRI